MNLWMSWFVMCRIPPLSVMYELFLDELLDGAVAVASNHGVAVMATVASMLQQAGSMLTVFFFCFFKAYHYQVRYRH